MKKPPRAAYPRGIEMEYARILLREVRALFDSIRKVVDRTLPTLEAPGGNRRTDSLADDMDAAFNPLTFTWHNRAEALNGDVRRLAEQTSDFNHRQLQRQFNAVLGVDVIGQTPGLHDELAVFARDNARLIKDIGDQAVTRVERLVMDAVRRGDATRDVQRAFEAELGVTERRAQLIAVDQIGKLNGQLTRLRQKAAGVTHYRWRGVLDRRERASHVAREGQTFSWDEPPPDGHPGEPVRCRCHAEPVLDIFGDLFEDAPYEKEQAKKAAELLKQKPLRSTPTPDQPAARRSNLLGGPDDAHTLREGGSRGFIKHDRELEHAWKDDRNLGLYDQAALPRLKRKYFSKFYADPELEQGADRFIQRWTTTRSSDAFQIAARRAWDAVAATGKATNEHEALLLQMAATREERWLRLSDAQKIPFPNSFNAFRGVSGLDAVLEVADAWRGGQDVAAQASSLSSWSIKRSAAGAFAKGGVGGVIYEAEIPFEQTIADLWVDDSRFLTAHWNQAEVIAALGPGESITVPKEKATVRYKGRVYRYAQRAALLSALEADGLVLD